MSNDKHNEATTVLGCGRMVGMRGKRAERRTAKLQCAEVLQGLIMDGTFSEAAKPLVWSFIGKLRAEKRKHPNNEIRGARRAT